MRILFVSRCPPVPLYWGDRLILYHLARELHTRGHTLDLLALDDAPEHTAEGPEWPFFAHIEVFQSPIRPPREHLRRLFAPFPRRPEQAWQPALARAITARIAAIRAAGTPYDAVHFHGTVQVYDYIHFAGGVPALIMPYDSMTLLYARRPRSLGWLMQTVVVAAYEATMYRHYRRVVLVAEPDAAMVKRLNPRIRTEVVPNGIDRATFHPLDSAREPNTIVMVAGYDYWPNADALAWLVTQVLPRVRARIPDVKLWAVGWLPPADAGDAQMGALVRTIEAAAREQPGITLTGRVPDVRPYLGRAAVSAVLLNAGAGIKNKVLEAMAMGTPVVGTPLAFDGIHAEDEPTLRDGTFARVVPPNSAAGAADAQAAALIDVLTRPDDATRMAAAAQALIAERYTWAAAATRIEALYRAIIDEAAAEAASERAGG